MSLDVLRSLRHYTYRKIGRFSVLGLVPRPTLSRVRIKWTTGDPWGYYNCAPRVVDWRSLCAFFVITISTLARKRSR